MRTVWPIIIEMAGPPRGKGTGRAAITNGHAHIYTDSKTRSYESQLRFAAQQQMGENRPTAQPIAVHVDVRLVIPTTWSKKKRALALAGSVAPTVKPDCNNFSKALDALNGIVWVDDKQIVDERVQKRYAEQPGLTIRVWTVVPPPVAVVRPKTLVERVAARAQADLFL